MWMYMLCALALERGKSCDHVQSFCECASTTPQIIQKRAPYSFPVFLLDGEAPE
jgi:hypothetical protein